MSDIKKARERVALVADWLESSGRHAFATELRGAIELMWRRPYARPRAPTKSNAVNGGMAEAMWVVARARPDLMLQDIAEMFGVNAGRVTEALQGMR